MLRTDGVLPQPSKLYYFVGCKQLDERNGITRPLVSGTLEHIHKTYSKGIWDETNKRNVALAEEIMNTLISMKSNYSMKIYISI